MKRIRIMIIIIIMMIIIILVYKFFHGREMVVSLMSGLAVLWLVVGWRG